MSGVRGTADVSITVAAGSRSGDPVTEAVNLLFRARHHLTPDVLRSLASVWECGSAARYGAPHERFWELDPSFYTDHDVAECEAENQPTDTGNPGSHEQLGAGA